MLYDAGVDPCAQKFLGHADLQVTLKIYTHLSEEERGVVDSLNRFLGMEWTLTAARREGRG